MLAVTDIQRQKQRQVIYVDRVYIIGIGKVQLLQFGQIKPKLRVFHVVFEEISCFIRISTRVTLRHESAFLGIKDFRPIKNIFISVGVSA